MICGIAAAFGADARQLDLGSDVVVQAAPARPCDHLTDAFTGIDPARPVHDVRGSMNRYTCLRPGDLAPRLPTPEGQTCEGGPASHASGVCSYDTFGDPHRTFNDVGYDIVPGIAPPTRDRRGAGPAG